MGVYSTKNRVTGLSGIDTETMITQLMTAHTLKLSKLQKNATKLEWKQEAYRSVASALDSFQTNYLSITSATSIWKSSNFSTNNATVTGNSSSAVSVSTSTGSVAGSYTLAVSQLATTDTYKSSAVLSASIKGKETFDPTTVQGGDSFKITYDGAAKIITFTNQDALDIQSGVKLYEDVLNGKLETAFGTTSGTAKVKATFTASGLGDGKGTLSIDPTAKGHALSITEAAQRTVANQAGSVAGAANIANLAGASYTIKVNNKEVVVDLTSLINGTAASSDVLKAINSALGTAGVSVVFADDGTGQITASVNGVTRSDIKMEDYGSGLLSALGYSGDVDLASSSVLANMGNIANGDSNAFGNDDYLSEVLASLFPVDATGTLISDTYQMTVNGVTITLNATDTISAMVKKVNNSGAGVTMAYSSLTESFSLKANEAGAINQIATDTNADAFLSSLNLVQDTNNTGTDAEFTINGIPTTRTGNTFTFEGTTFTLNDTTPLTDPVTITITKDNTATTNLVKEFVSAYNSLISSINAVVDEKKAKSSGSYFEPLTDSEKKDMSENEITTWEEKAKQGILSGDSILSGITSAMRTQLYQSVTLDDGTKLSLYQLGITTDTYDKQGQLVIDEDKFAAALEKYGSKISEFFSKSADANAVTNAEKQATTGIGGRLINIVNAAIGNTGSISNKAGIKGKLSEFSNTLLTEINRNATKITDMITWLTDKEEGYYNMFSKLEAAITAADSQMAYLESILSA